jgi:integrase
MIGYNPKNGRPIRKTVYGELQKDVVAAMKTISAKIENGTYQHKTKYTVATWLDQWLKNIMFSIEPATYKTYEVISRVHIKPAVGSIKLEKLKSQDIQNLINLKHTSGRADRKPGGLGHRTLCYIKLTLNCAMSQAVKQQIIVFNPVAGITMPKKTKTDLRSKAFTHDELKIFLDGTKGSEYYQAWRFAFLTGLRRGELLGLKWKDVDFMSNQIVLKRQIVMEGNLIVCKEQLKTAASSATIVVTSPAIETLKKHKLDQSEDLLKIGEIIKEDDYIFCKFDRSPYRPDTFTTSFSNAVAKLNLRKGLSLHSTRHTFATMASDAGVDIKKLQLFMRHTDIKVTAGYMNPETKVLEKEIEKFGDSFNVLDLSKGKEK